MKSEALVKIRYFIPVHSCDVGLAIVTLRPVSLIDSRAIEDFGREVIEYALSHPGSDMVVDFHQVHYMSSSVLSELLRLKRLLDSQGGMLRICGLHKEARELFAMTKLDHLFCLQPDLRHALRHYGEVEAGAQPHVLQHAANRQ